MNLNSKHIQDAVNRLFPNNRYVLFNSYVFDWESDYFSVSIPKNFCIEVEIKISQADFKKDFTHKKEKHRLLSKAGNKLVTRQYPHVWRQRLEKGIIVEGEYCTVDFVNPVHYTPNKFYYAAPEGLIKPHQIPTYAGLIEIVDRSEHQATPYAYTKKVAPFLHKENVFDKMHKVLMDKFWWETHKMRTNFMVDYEYQKYLVKELRKNLNLLQKENS